MYRNEDEGGSDSSETGTTSGGVLDSKTKRDKDLALDKKKSSEHGFTTYWGPVGFQKKLHPLSIMVGLGWYIFTVVEFGNVLSGGAQPY